MQNIRYNIQDLPQDASEIRLIYCAIARYNTSWHSILHRHPHAELFFCLDGKGELQIASERVPLEKGDFFLINPGVEHTERSSLLYRHRSQRRSLPFRRHIQQIASLPDYQKQKQRTRV